MARCGSARILLVNSARSKVNTWLTLPVVPYPNRARKDCYRCAPALALTRKSNACWAGGSNATLDKKKAPSLDEASS